MIAYFDANPVDHCMRLEGGVTTGIVTKLETAIATGRIVVPMSIITTEELISATLRDEQHAAEAGRLYLRLASLNRTLKQPRDLVGDAIRAYATRAGEPSPYMPLDRATRLAWERFATGNEPLERIRTLVAEVQQEITDFFEFMMGGREEREEHMREVRKRVRRREDRISTLDEVFDYHAPRYAASFAERYGALSACRRRGVQGLLRRKRVLAAVGGGIALVYRQLTDGLRPDRGDSRDLQHIVMATAAGGLLVTHDRRLRILTEGIPGLGLPVMSVAELVNVAEGTPLIATHPPSTPVRGLR